MAAGMPGKRREDLFRIFETDQFLKDMQKLDVSIRDRVYKKTERSIYPQIKSNPYYGKNIKKLKAYRPLTWRYKLGDLRIFYEIEDKERIINILTMDFRGNIYK
jgi:mRNA interferase RelE/StbE